MKRISKMEQSNNNKLVILFLVAVVAFTFGITIGYIASGNKTQSVVLSGGETEEDLGGVHGPKKLCSYTTCKTRLSGVCAAGEKKTKSKSCGFLKLGIKYYCCKSPAALAEEEED